MSKIQRVILSDGRIFSGCVVIDDENHVDLVWTDRGVNHQVSVPKNLIDTIEEAGPTEIRPDGEGKFVCKACLGKFLITDMSLGHCVPCWEGKLAKEGATLPS